MSDDISTELIGRVMTITLNRPEAKNAITHDMYTQISDALDEADKRSYIRCVILTAIGDTFTSGNDLQELVQPKPSGKLPALRFLETLRDLKTPILCAVNGSAIGIGLSMLLHCDLVYASDNAMFSAPSAQLGLVPDAASSMLLPLYVGNAWANDILLAARKVSAKEALAIGLVSRVVPEVELRSLASKVAKNVSEFPPNAMRKSKRLIRANRSLIAVRMSHESKVFAEQLSSSEFKEAVKSVSPLISNMA